MKIIAIVGRSHSGKTNLIKHIIPELNRRGYKVAVIKHCPHGFSLSPEGKDTWRFMQSGAEGVAMLGPDRLAWLRKTRDAGVSFKELAEDLFAHIDFVLVEGGHREKHIPKLIVLKRVISEEIICPPDEIAAVISDGEGITGKPVFHPDDISQIANFLEKGI